VKVWIDFSNSPHPLLFAPVAQRLQQLGHEVAVTARDNAQTRELTLQRWPHATIFGGESPKSRAGKAKAMATRVRDLRRWARAFAPDVALSHNSYGQILAARALGVQVVTAMDYEGQPANHLAFRLARTVLVPHALRGSAILRQGAAGRRVRFYEGFKEELYLGDFRPDLNIASSLGLADDCSPLVVIRTPPSRATYHRFENPLFEAVLEKLSAAQVRCVALVRHAEQRSAIERRANIVVPDRAIDSRSLMYQADLVIGAGGTMTREAALMGIPTYSLFAGAQPAVDRELERQGRLRRLRDCDELGSPCKRAREPRTPAQLRSRATELVQAFVQATTG
jgi:hypothetical protein